MPCSIAVLPERQLALVHLEGRINGRDCCDALESLIAFPEWSPGFRVIWDLRAVTYLVMESRDAEALAKLSRKMGDDLCSDREAVIATSDESFAIMNMLTRRLKKQVGRNITTFRTADEALMWMEIMPEFTAEA